MDALTNAQLLWGSIVNGPGFAALELADAVSGGHIKEAARTSDELFSAAVAEDTRDAVLPGLDLARLTDARFRVVMELIDCILQVQDELTQRCTYDASQRPELRDLQAASALVAAGGFVVIYATVGGGKFIRSRFEAPPGSPKLSIRRTHKGSKLLAMIDAGRDLDRVRIAHKTT